MKRVLLIEDDALFRKSLAVTIASLGVEVLPAESGERGLQVLESVAVDLMVADYQLPGISGLDVIQQARERGLTIPMVLVSASLNEETEARARKQHVDALFRKSSDQLRKLGPAISTLLQQSGAKEDE